MPNQSPNIGLHLTPDDDPRNYKELRLEISGESEDSNMMILDKEIGALNGWKGRHVINSTSETKDQQSGDTWNEVIP